MSKNRNIKIQYVPYPTQTKNEKMGETGTFEEVFETIVCKKKNRKKVQLCRQKLDIGT